MYDILVWITTNMLPKRTGYHYDPIILKMFLANQFPSQLFNFTIGMYFASLYYSLTPKVKEIFTNIYGGALLLILFGMLAYMAWLFSRIDVFGGMGTYTWFVGVSVVCATLVFLSAHQNIVSEYVLGASWVRLIGAISYSIYLWHFPVIYFVKKYWVPVGVDGLDRFYWMLMHCTPITLIISLISYRYIKMPFLSMAKAAYNANK